MPETSKEHEMNPAEQAEFDKAIQGNRERPVVPDFHRDHLADETSRVLEFKPRPATTQVEKPKTEVSDQTQKFLDRLAQSQSPAESAKIINEVLEASHRNQIPPYEAAHILDGLDKAA